MSWKSSFFIIFALLSLLGMTACQNAKPQLGSMGSLGGITLDHNSKTLSANSFIVSFSGKCQSVFSDIEWSDNGGSTWTSIRISDPAAVLDCAGTGVFSGTLDLRASATATQLSAKISTSILFRGVSDLGNSNSLALLLIPPSGAGTPKIVVGAHTTNSGGYVFKGQVGGHVTQTITSGYVLQGQVHYK